MLYPSYTTILRQHLHFYLDSWISLCFFFYPFMVTYNISQRSQSYKDSRTPSVHGSLPSPLTSMTATGRNPALCELNWSSLSIFFLLSWTFRISLTVFYSKHTESMTYSQIRRKSGEYALSCSPFIFFSLSDYLQFHTDPKGKWTGWQASWHFFFFIITTFQNPFDPRNLIGFIEDIFLNILGSSWRCLDP